jgi:predicted ArsR family transcriptional regulator
VHVNTLRPHLRLLEGDRVLNSRQRRAKGHGRRVIE